MWEGEAGGHVATAERSWTHSVRRQDLDRHLKEVGEEVSSMHTKKRIPKNALLKLNTQIKIIAEKCGEFEDFRLRKANIGPQDGNFIQQGCVLFIGWCLDGIAGERDSLPQQEAFQRVWRPLPSMEEGKGNPKSEGNPWEAHVMMWPLSSRGQGSGSESSRGQQRLGLL